MPDPDDEVRRLLASARADEPPPPEVAARLDRVLADLAEQRTARVARDELAARRRRRSRLLGRGAAAVVAVAALVGGGLAIRSVDLSGGTASDSADSGAGGSAGEGAAAPNDGRPVPALRPGHLRADILSRTTARQRAGTAEPGPAACVVPTAGQTALAVDYGLRLAALVLDRPSGGTQRATVYTCAGVHSGDPVRRLVLPAP